MDKTFNKETFSFYLVAFASALAAIASMCTSALWRATSGMAAGFALYLPALILACFGFSYPSPLNKVRCAAMLGNTLTLTVLFVSLFIAGDLAGAKIVFYTVAGVFQPNIMGILLVVYMSFGLLVAIMTITRVLMQTFGKSLNDLERQLSVLSSEATRSAARQEVTPRTVDEKQVLAKADQEVRMNRMSITSAEVESRRPAVTPAEARARGLSQPVQTKQPDIIAEVTPVRQQVIAAQANPVPDEQAAPPPIRDYNAIHVQDEAEDVRSVAVEQAEEEKPIRSILDEDAVQSVTPEVQDVIYADDLTDDDDAPMIEVEMARGEELVDADIRTEMATHRLRPKDQGQDRNLYTDFSYGDDKSTDEQ